MNNFIEIIKKRRSVYNLNRNLPVFPDKIVDLVRDSVHLVPDAFDMKSQRVMVLLGGQHEKFWDAVYDELVKYTGESFSRERIDSFAAGAGTILYFYDVAAVEETRRAYPMYVEHFHDWVMQSNGMLQFTIWTGLAAMDVGANLQHYNPVIDKMVRDMFDLPDVWTLVAQMPFGGIGKMPTPKPDEDMNIRVKIEK